MNAINIHQAKTHLSKLVEEASRGEPFVIAKAGKLLLDTHVLLWAAVQPERLSAKARGLLRDEQNQLLCSLPAFGKSLSSGDYAEKPFRSIRDARGAA